MTDFFKAHRALVLWTLIAVSFPLFFYVLSNAFCLNDMVARAERRELDRHLRNLTVALATSPLQDFAQEEGTFANPDLRTMQVAGDMDEAFARKAGSAVAAGNDFGGLLRTVAFAGDGWPVGPALRPVDLSYVLPATVPTGNARTPVVADFKRKSGTDAAVFAAERGKVRPLASTRADVAWLSEADLRHAATGGILLKERRFGDVDTVVMAGPVHDEAGRRVGVAVVARDRSDLVAGVKVTRDVLLGIGMLLFFISALVIGAASDDPARA